MIERFIALDVETANASQGSICQIGLVEFVNGEERSAHSWLVDPEDYFDGYNTNLHGIGEHHVRGQPNFGARIDAILDLVGEDIVVAHTAFDRGSIGRACERYGAQSPEWRWLDSARVARRCWPDVKDYGYGLKPLAARCGISFRHHDAVEDARACGLILLKLLEETGQNADYWLAAQTRAITSKRDPTREGHADGLLSGEHIVFTGSLCISRKEAADMADRLGAAVDGGVKRSTTMLVVGDQDITKLGGKNKSSKHLKAEACMEKGQPIRILGESDFLALVGPIEGCEIRAQPKPKVEPVIRSTASYSGRITLSFRYREE